eukprot:m.71091 g.71091  ORF g.71091 m.71091 type:complete len:143 (+) comp16074_c0_seq1:38-466(+)
MADDKEAMFDICADVRDDATETSWATFVYDKKAKNIIAHATGTSYESLLGNFTDDLLLYAYVRLETGDELSKRAKFALITWLGNNVSGITKAQAVTKKGFVHQITKTFAAEIECDCEAEVEYNTILEQVKKAGGANYGTGVR